MQGGIGCGIKYQARCISDVKADTDHTSFLAGTLSLKEENEVHLLRLLSDGTELVCVRGFSRIPTRYGTSDRVPLIRASSRVSSLPVNLVELQYGRFLSCMAS